MKNEKKGKVLSSTYLFQKPWLTVRQDKLQLANGVVIPEYFVLEYPDWVNVLAITKDKKFLMIRQYRHGTQSTNFEFCGGCVDKTDASPCHKPIIVSNISDIHYQKSNRYNL